MTLDRKHQQHRDRIFSKIDNSFLPSPHGRSLAPWRELADDPDMEDHPRFKLPARDYMPHSWD